MTATISQLFIYPIKSCRRVAVTHAELTETGLKHDRQWMIVDEKGAFLSQRQRPRLAQIQPEVHDDHLTISIPQQAPLTLPHYTEDFGQIAVTVWKSQCRAQHMGPEIDEALSQFLGHRVHLVTLNQNERRLMTSSRRAFDGPVSFADGYPFLLTSERSLAALNARLETPVPMERFRSNIVVTGTLEPFAEDHWQRLEIATTLFHVCKPCSRCTVITVDQDRGEKSSGEPLRTLAQFRQVDREILFGMNLQHEFRAGQVLAVGDEVRVGEART